MAIIATEAWEPLLRSVHGEAIRSSTRTFFEGWSWDRERLAGFRRALPAGYRLLRITSAEVGRFAELDRSLIVNFRDPRHFLDAGFGFAVEHAGRLVAGCSTFTIADGEVEVEIDTLPEHRRRGLALATGSALILHCLELGLEPCWDAANEASVGLARRLGCTAPKPYTARLMKRPQS